MSADDMPTNPGTPQAITPAIETLRDEIAEYVASKLGAMINATENRLADKFERHIDDLADAIREQSALIREQGEQTRTNSAQLAGQIQGAIAAARDAANEVLEHNERVNVLTRELRATNHRIESLELGGERLYKNGTAGENGSDR